MRRTIVVICAALLGITALTVGVPAIAGTAPARAGQAQGRQAQNQLRANEHAARADARRLLTRVRLPPSGIGPTGKLPAFARSFATSSSPKGTYYASFLRWIVSSASPRSIIAYVRKHPPAGSTEDVGTGSSSDTKTGVSSVEVQFSWPDVPRQLMNRALTVTVVTPADGNSVVIAQSESAWYVPRSFSERVPGGVHTVAITVRLGPATIGPVVKPGGRVHTTTYVVWRPARVRALVSTFDGLPIVQPAVQPLGCPLILTGSSASELTLAFKTGRGGATLARAQVNIHRGGAWEDGGGACDPIDFWIGGRQQTELTSPTFVKQIGKLVGADIS
jgi:hypothetical protein